MSLRSLSNQNKAVGDIVELIVATIGDEWREIDTTDAISTTARLAGSFLYRYYGFKIIDVKFTYFKTSKQQQPQI